MIDIYLFLIRTPNIDCGFCCSSIHRLIEKETEQKPDQSRKDDSKNVTQTTRRDPGSAEAVPEEPIRDHGSWKY